MPDFTHEDLHGRLTGTIVAGVDEVGRGPLAGPVVAAAVIWPHDRQQTSLWQKIDDSKKLKSSVRAELSLQIRADTIWAIAEASVEEIDSLNILHASLLAMRRAVDRLSCVPDICLIDGNRKPKGSSITAQTIIGGDAKSLSIAAASIIAKEYRDARMRDLAELHPSYGWDRNAGYGTAQHLAALAEHGPTMHHRYSFAPVRLHSQNAA